MHNRADFIRFLKFTELTAVILTMPAIAVYAEQPTSKAQESVPADVTELLSKLPQITELRTEMFSILTHKTEDARRVAEVAEKLEGHVRAILKWKFSESTTITVMISGEPAEQDFTPYTDSRGNCAVVIGGDINKISLHKIGEILASTLIKQYAAEKSIALPNGGNAPLWLTSALATEAEIAHSQGRFLLLRKQAEQTSPLPFATIFEGTFPAQAETVQFQQNAFWCCRFIRKHSRAKEITIDDFLRKGAAALPRKNMTEKEVNLWWRTQFFEQIEKSPAGTESLAQSQKRFGESMKFLVKIDGIEKRISAGELQNLADLHGIRLLAYARMDELAENIPVTNPAWHNAFAELGTYFELIARAEANADGLHTQWEKTEAAKKEAEVLTNEINKLLYE